MLRPASAIVFCTLFSTWQYITVALPTCGNCPAQMQAIVDGTAQAPFAYRILTPVIIVAMGNTIQALVLFHLVMFAVFFSLLWIWARRWQANPVTAVFAAALLLVVSFPTWYFSAYSITEWVLWLGVLLLLPPFSPSVH